MTPNERIKLLRKSLNLTTEKFGEALGVTRAAISNIENGNRNVTEQMFKSICREFNIREEWLRDGIEPREKDESRNEELSKFFEDVLKDEDDSYRKRFIEALAKLDVSDWEVVERFLGSVLERNNKKDDQN